MSYHIYKTHGLILGGYDKSEASRMLSILTKEHGLVLATAQSVRELKSKLRYGLQDLSYSHIDLVKGKGGWRVVNAQNKENFSLHTGVHAQKKRATSARIGILLKRLLKGEEGNECLFDEVVSAFSFIQNTELDEHELFSTEVIIVMKILNILGYWGEEHDEFIPFLRKEKLDAENVKAFASLKPLALREINKSLRETQL